MQTQRRRNRSVSFERLEWMLGRTDGEGRREQQCQEERARERSMVRRAVAQALTPTQREAVLLYYYQGLTIPQIARLQGCNKSNISRILKRARHNLMCALQYLPSLYRAAEDIAEE